MKKLIVTRADNNIKEMTNITHLSLKKYAKKCDADFKVLDDSTCSESVAYLMYRILKIYDLFEDYDRILHLDSDMLVKNNCPNLFDIVPVSAIGCVYEDKGSRKEDRRNRIKRVQQERKDVGWTKGYLNAAVTLFSKMHRNIFNLEFDKVWKDIGYEGVELGYQIHKNGYEIHELPCEFNFMSMFAESWCKKDKFDAFILHYAGRGFYLSIDRIEQIRQDCRILKKYEAI